MPVVLKDRFIILVACVVYVISAIFNTGFYYFDEHYQLIEFAELKSGNNTPADLAWEYEAKVRPAIQPLIAHLFFSTLRFINISDPYILMIGLRFLTALFALVIVTYFIKKTEYLIINHLRVWYKILAYFLWFLPFVNVRFSSESYSGLTFLLALALLYSGSVYRWFFIGCLLGLSFLFRFQTAFMSLGFLLWLFFIYKIDFKNLLKIITGGLSVIVVGVVIDYWFYETATITFVNYFNLNIIEDVASSYGISPWYYYFIKSSEAAITPFGVFIWICVLSQFVFDRKSLLCWIVTPFLLIHFITPHKELRFLFPLVNLLPLLIMMTIQSFNKIEFLNKQKMIIGNLAIIFLIVNVLVLAINMFSPADDQGRINITREIHNHYKNKKVTLWAFSHDNPYKPISPSQNFYRDTNVNCQPFILDSILKSPTTDINLLVIRNDRIESSKSLFNVLPIVRTKMLGF